MTDIETIVSSIDNRLSELAREITKLEAARTALGQNGAVATKPARPRRRRQPAKRPTEVVPAGKLEQMLADGDGLTTGELAKQANGSPAQVRTLLRELESAGRVRRTGERRATRWHIVTDEDRIAARAAELEAQHERITARAKPSVIPDADAED